MNWKKLIEDLVIIGMTQTQIAEACKTTQSNIWYLVNTKQRTPNWELGQSLIKLHDDRCGEGTKRK